MAREQITLHLPSSETIVASTNAVTMIGEILTLEGFKPLPLSFSNTPVVAAYQGTGRLACFISRENQTVEVIFSEMGRIKSRPDAIKARNAIQKKLSEHFGKDKVNP